MVKNNGTGEMVYDYDKKGDLIRSSTISHLTNQPVFITDYFFDSSGRRYASVMHSAGESNSYTSSGTKTIWIWQRRFEDSIINYYVYDKDNKLSRAYRKYENGALRFESLYSYHPLTITWRSYDREQHLTGETKDFYEKEQFLIKSILNRYDSNGQVISTSTQTLENIYNEAGQVTEVNYRNDTCSCISKYKYYSNGLMKSRKNERCAWNKKFKYRYYKKHD